MLFHRWNYIYSATAWHKKWYCLCYGLPVRLSYVVITCARTDSTKHVCSEPPCCPGVFNELSSVHDNFGDEDGILRDILRRESEDIPTQDPYDVSRCQTSLMRYQIRFVTSGKFRSSQWELTSRRMQNSWNSSSWPTEWSTWNRRKPSC